MNESMRAPSSRSTRRRRAAWSPAIAIALAVLLYLAVAPVGGSTTPAERLAFTDINPRSASYGRSLALDDLYAERGVVLRFIASWCEVCRDELPGLQELQASRNAPIVLVAADEYGPPDSLLIVAERNALSAPILFVPEEQAEQVAARFDYETLPATYMIDRQGTVRMTHEGAMPVERLAQELQNGLGI